MKARFKESGIDPFSVENYLLEVDRPLVVPKGQESAPAADRQMTSFTPGGCPILQSRETPYPGIINEAWFTAA